MDRNRIERTDFSVSRRGYDPDEVNQHLRTVADEVETLRRSKDQAGLATTAAEQVRGIIEAAERSAAEIQQRAEDEARRIGGDAEAHAREVREQADTDAATHVQRVQEATDQLLDRASAADSEVGSLLDSLRTEAGSLVDGMRTRAESIRRELEQIQAGLPALREARGVAATAPRAEAVAAGETVPPEESPSEDVAPAPGEEPPTAEEELAVEEEPAEGAPVESAGEPEQQAIAGAEGARLIALNMALNGTPREETAAYLSQNFDLEDQDAVLDEVYSRVGG